MTEQTQLSQQQWDIKTTIQKNPIKDVVNPWIQDLSKTIKKTQTSHKPNQISVQLDKFENRLIKSKQK